MTPTSTTRLALAAFVAACWLAAFAPRPVLAASAPSAPPPMFVTQGDRLVVPDGSPLRQRVQVAAVGSEPGRSVLALPAMVEADPSRVVAIVAPLAGRLTRLQVGLGDFVRRGQPLATINSPDFGQALTDLAKAQDALDLSQRALNRARGVQAAGANAGKDIEAAEASLRDAQAEDRRARDRVATLSGGAQVDVRERSLTVLAPASGTVTAVNVGAGSYLNDPTATLLTLSGLDRVFVTALVPEGSLASVPKTGTVEVSFPGLPGVVLHGKPAPLSPVLEPDTRRAKLRIPFDNPEGRLKPNMFATVSVAVTEHGGVSVPPSALLMNNDSTTVLVEVAPWTFQRRTVEIGNEDDKTVQITSGLQSGDRVVVRGGVLLND